MICRFCSQPYTEDSDANLRPTPDEVLGWHVSYGACYLCYCFELFCGNLEPPNPKSWQAVFGINCPSEREPNCGPWGDESIEIPF